MTFSTTRRLTYRSMAVIAGFILTLSASGVGYAAEANITQVGHEAEVNTGIGFTSPAQPNTSGGYTTEPGEGGVISLPNPPGSKDTIHVGGVKNNPPYTTIPVFTPGSFYLDSTEYSITTGDTLDTVALFKTDSGSVQTLHAQVYYSSNHPDIAQIDSQGNITGIRPGLAQITAVHAGLQFTASVLVVSPYAAQ
ncbi:Ig-like domain-containing protein [Paenibacillus sp. YPG26]|uniref:Ig-like domain-containing protein n=1 Tax=Paenibacillus sp. YPG26 TaxID=2878915 RepID=UPI00203C4F6C|nr:Ig-like domain-containing protein [Paenibacillus sp. YPG26]USB31929.1 Ig-like domain-containing protein [Paenibacillus sp. YPG26]